MRKYTRPSRAAREASGAPCPGRSAARSDALQSPGPRFLRCRKSNRGPGSAVHSAPQGPRAARAFGTTRWLSHAFTHPSRALCGVWLGAPLARGWIRLRLRPHERPRHTVRCAPQVGRSRGVRRDRDAGPRRRRTGSSAASTCSTFAAKRGLDEEKAIAAFLHAARLGLFELSLERALPGLRRRARRQRARSRSVHEEVRLRALRRRLRADARRDGRGHLHRQPARAPHRGARSRTRCRSWEYFRQIFWSSGVDLPETGLEDSARGDHARCDRAAARREGAPVAAAAGGIRHRVRSGDARRAFHRRQGRADARAPERCRWSSTRCSTPTGTTEMRPGPLRLSLDNRTDRARAAGACGSPATRCTICSASAGRSSPPSACSPTRRSATSIAPTRSTSTSG